LPLFVASKRQEKGNVPGTPPQTTISIGEDRSFRCEANLIFLSMLEFAMDTFIPTAETRFESMHPSRLNDENSHAYLAYYHRSRTHLGLNKDAPDGRPASAAAGALIVTPEVGGLHHRYDRQAA
jgi:hypothetical protein